MAPVTPGQGNLSPPSVLCRLCTNVYIPSLTHVIKQNNIQTCPLSLAAGVSLQEGTEVRGLSFKGVDRRLVSGEGTPGCLGVCIYRK